MLSCCPLDSHLKPLDKCDCCKCLERHARNWQHWSATRALREREERTPDVPESHDNLQVERRPSDALLGREAWRKEHRMHDAASTSSEAALYRVGSPATHPTQEYAAQAELWSIIKEAGASHLGVSRDNERTKGLSWEKCEKGFKSLRIGRFTSKPTNTQAPECEPAALFEFIHFGRRGEGGGKAWVGYVCARVEVMQLSDKCSRPSPCPVRLSPGNQECTAHHQAKDY